MNITSNLRNPDLPIISKNITTININETANDAATNSAEEFEIDLSTLKTGIEVPSGTYVESLPPDKNCK